jgi:hypothetical protein
MLVFFIVLLVIEVILKEAKTNDQSVTVSTSLLLTLGLGFSWLYKQQKMNYKHTLSLAEYLKTSVFDLLGIDQRAQEYYRQHQESKIAYKLYGGKKPLKIDCWMFYAYLHTVDCSASYAEVIENATKKLDMARCLEYLIEVQCPTLIHDVEEGKIIWNYDPEEENPIWASFTEVADICTEVQMSDTIQGIAIELRSLIDFSYLDILDCVPDPFNEAWLSAAYGDNVIDEKEYNLMLDKIYPETR